MSFTTTAAAVTTAAFHHQQGFPSDNNPNNNNNNSVRHHIPGPPNSAPQSKTLSRPPRSRPSALGNLATASTPNLNSLYSAHSRLAPPGLSRKASFQALTPNSLAAIPDDTESYALGSVLNQPSATASFSSLSPSLLLSPSSAATPTNNKMPPLTPGRASAADSHIAIGDTVDVPGSMFGTVRFIGQVQGRKGIFAGVELHPDYASRGKNNGDVDGVSYFTTSNPGAGIFLPLSKAVKRDSPSTSSNSSFPLTPTMPTSGLKVGTQNSTNYTPPTPSIPKFSQSVGPGRAPSPVGKRPRTSLPRPDSPVRRLQMTPGPRPSIATPAPTTRAPSKYGSPTSNKFSQSVRGTTTTGDPSKPRGGLKLERKQSVGVIGPRSASALGGSSTGLTDDETTPVGLKHTKTNGSLGSVSSFSAKLRPPSRAANGAGHGASPVNGQNGEEAERLRAQLEDRDRQLKEQAQTLAEMESSLTELQMLMENPDGLPPQRRNSLEDKDTSQLRALLREKNEKIAMLTAEFDAHRADFRSTIDTLELASTETERVYEKKLEEVMQELHDYQERTSDVNAVAKQLKQLEELVQELEEGLEDARRGEAEARGEVEFLRGEVERTRSELRREREKAAAAANGNGTGTNGDRASIISKELEQKEDEIRGLKAIIHSLSRDSIPGGLPGPMETYSPDKTPTMSSTQFKGGHGNKESPGDRLARERLEREVAELRALLDSKNNREVELERELDQLQRGGAGHRGSSMTITSIGDRSSFRDSRGTVILAREHETRSPEVTVRKTHARDSTLDTMLESDTYSTATENSSLWCEMCDTAGHDILNCTNIFTPPQPQPDGHNTSSSPASTKTGRDAVRAGLKDMSLNPGHRHTNSATPAPLSPMKTKTSIPPPSGPPPPAIAEVRILPNLNESGPIAGKSTGVVDVEKWCAVCERDGHDSVDCPFEDAL